MFPYFVSFAPAILSRLQVNTLQNYPNEAIHFLNPFINTQTRTEKKRKKSLPVYIVLGLNQNIFHGASIRLLLILN